MTTQSKESLNQPFSENYLAPVLQRLLSKNYDSPSLKSLAAEAKLPAHELRDFFKTLPFSYDQWIEKHRQKLYPKRLPRYLADKFIHAKERALERYGYILSERDYMQLNLMICKGHAKKLAPAEHGFVYEVSLNGQTFYAVFLQRRILTFYHKGWLKDQGNGEIGNTKKRKAKHIRESNRKTTLYLKING